MKTNPFAYLSKAPKIKGARRLRPNEIAKEGDRYMFLTNWEGLPPTHLPVLNAVGGSGLMKIGTSLVAARRQWGSGPREFDGVIYRPATSKKVSS